MVAHCIIVTAPFPFLGSGDLGLGDSGFRVDIVLFCEVLEI